MARLLIVISILILITAGLTAANAQNNTTGASTDTKSTATKIPPFMTVLEEDTPEVTFYIAKSSGKLLDAIDNAVGLLIDAIDKNKMFDKMASPMVIIYMSDKESTPANKMLVAAGMVFKDVTETPKGLEKLVMPAHTGRVVYFKGPYTGTKGSRQGAAWQLVSTVKDQPIPTAWWPYEIYLISYDKTDDEQDFVTKIVWPIQLLNVKDHGKKPASETTHPKEK